MRCVMQRKFQVIIFCKNDEKFDEFTRGLGYYKPIKMNVCDSKEYYYEYEYIEITRFKCKIGQYFKGYKCDLVVVDKDLFEDEEYLNEIVGNVTTSMLAHQRLNLKVQYI